MDQVTLSKIPDDEQKTAQTETSKTGTKRKEPESNETASRLETDQDSTLEKKQKIDKLDDEIRAALESLGPDEINEWKSMGRDVQLWNKLHEKYQQTVEAGLKHFTSMTKLSLEWLKTRSRNVRETIRRGEAGELKFSSTFGSTMIADLLAQIIKSRDFDNRNILVVTPSMFEASIIRDKLMGKMDETDRDRLLEYKDTRISLRNLDAPLDITKVACLRTKQCSIVRFYNLNKAEKGLKGLASSPNIFITFELAETETTRLVTNLGAAGFSLTWAVHPRLY